MHILEIKEVANSKIIYDFQVNKRVLNISSDRLITDKWLTLENWHWIYKRMSEIALEYINDKSKFEKDDEIIDSLPGLLCLKLKLKQISKEFKKLLDIWDYEFDHYFEIKVEYRDDILERELNKFQTLPVEDKLNNKYDRKDKNNEYSPTRTTCLSSFNSYTPKNKSSKREDTEVLSYTPTNKRNQNQNNNEYVPKGVEKLNQTNLLYTPTKITANENSDHSIISSTNTISSRSDMDDGIDLNKNIGRSNRNGKRVNYCEKSPIDELPRKKKYKDKKDKIAELFDDESDKSDKDDMSQRNEIKSPSKRAKSGSSTSKSSKKSKMLDQKVDMAIKQVTPSLDTCSKVSPIMDTSFPIRNINCFNMKEEEIKKSFKKIKPRMDKVIDDFHNNKIIKLKKTCDDPYVVHEIFSAKQLEIMYSYLQDQYLSDDESGASYCELITNHLLPTWALTLYSQTHKIPLAEVLNVSL